MIAWPDGKKIAVALTFDFDAEFYWSSRDPKLVTYGNLARGVYGAQEGIYRVLDMLKAQNVPATFFVSGAVAEKYKTQVQLIADNGFEIGYHGYAHEQIKGISYEEEWARMEKCEAILEDITHKKIIGHRAPAGVMHPFTMAMIAKRGYLYSSSMKDSDSPYLHQINGKEVPVVEICADQYTDDSTYYAFCLSAGWVRRGICPPRVYRECLQRDFAMLSTEPLRTLVIKCHPQLIGRADRIKSLAEFVAYMQERDAWIASCAEIARYVLANR